jgi:O-antigen ligase
LIIFSVSASQAPEPAWALVQVAILSILILYCLLVTNLTIRAPAFTEKLVDALLFFGVITAVLGLYEHVRFLLLGPSRSMLIPYLLPPNPLARVGGPYGQPNQLAVFLLVSLLAFFYRYVNIQPISKPSYLFRLRFVPFALVAVVFFMTLSRSGLLSLCFIMGFLTWLVTCRRYLANSDAGRREFFSLLFMLGATFLLLKVWAWSHVAGAPQIRSLGDTGINPSGRYVFWMSAILIFRDHPWLGVGLDQYKNIMNGYGPLSHDILGFVPYEAMKSTNWAHNELLQILCEGGVFAFALVVFLLGLLFLKIVKNFVQTKIEDDSLYLYSHLFLLPFIIQAMFGWSLRSTPLLILFFALLGLLLAQYPLCKINIHGGRRVLAQLILFSGLSLAVMLFWTEIELGTFKHEFLQAKSLEVTLPEFVAFAENPYTAFRVMNRALPGYLHAALTEKDNRLALQILPYYQRLCSLEGARWEWYDLARLYLKVGRENDSRSAIQQAVQLSPMDPRIGAFLHYLNMLKAARATGRPLSSFWPHGQKIDFSRLEIGHD